MPEKLTIRRPDDWHLHLRDGAALNSLVPCSSRYCGRAVIMPNLVPPVTSIDAALAYRQRILAALPATAEFNPLMALYLTEDTRAEDIYAAKACSSVIGYKLYPAGATTNSEAGVNNLQTLYPVFEAMAEAGLPLLVHGEVTRPDADVFDREARFVDEILQPLTETFDELRVVLEHVSSKHAVDFVRASRKNLAATITPQHLFMNRNAMLAGGIRPHNYCLPVLKRERDRRALVAAATSGDARFFMGTDSAPHVRSDKESACGCAGTFNAPVALSIYAAVFEQAGELQRLEAFTSQNGPGFYGLDPNDDTITLEKTPWQVPQTLGDGELKYIPWLAGETLDWQVTG